MFWSFSSWYFSGDLLRQPTCSLSKITNCCCRRGCKRVNWCWRGKAKNCHTDEDLKQSGVSSLRILKLIVYDSLVVTWCVLVCWPSKVNYSAPWLARKLIPQTHDLTIRSTLRIYHSTIVAADICCEWLNKYVRGGRSCTDMAGRIRTRWRSQAQGLMMGTTQSTTNSLLSGTNVAILSIRTIMLVFFED